MTHRHIRHRSVDDDAFGALGQVEFATIDNKPNLAAGDFIVN